MAPHTLRLLVGELAISRLAPDAPPPDWAQVGELTSITRTRDELSVVCAAAAVPDDIPHDRGWRALELRGPLDFDLVGILADLSATLADAGVSIFAISTHDTDYVLVRAHQLDQGVTALEAAGYRVE